MEDIMPDDLRAATLMQEHHGPVVMMNLLKFKQQTADGRSGAEAYNAYGGAVAKMISGVGGEVVWWGLPKAVLIGGDADRWDAVAMVRYPTPAALFQMMELEEYKAIHSDREAALERTALLACVEIPLRDPAE